MNDLDRARELGLTIEEFQSLVGYDSLDSHQEFIHGGTHGPKDKRDYTDDDDDVTLKLKKKKDKQKATEAGGAYSLHDEFTDVTGIGDGTTVPFATDEDVRNKTSRELEQYWDRPVTSAEDKVLYLGYHIHGKDNVYGLHAHYPGGPLGGGHLHGPQNLLGYHTHRYSQEDLLQFKFARPGIMIELDGPHNHQSNAPDGQHSHAEENFGPASDERASEVAARNTEVDKN